MVPVVGFMVYWLCIWDETANMTPSSGDATSYLWFTAREALRCAGPVLTPMEYRS
jgi:hypothetical protein